MSKVHLLRLDDFGCGLLPEDQVPGAARLGEVGDGDAHVIDAFHAPDYGESGQSTKQPSKPGHEMRPRGTRAG